ncbi:MAG: aspartate carbamoyltransferase, partial [Oscillospiraceae bacterium]
RDVDCDPRARYFEQVKCGRFMRMALIMFLLENSAEPRVNTAFVNFESAGRCSNARCITASEPSLERLLVTADTSGKYRCAYCDFDIVMP